MQHPVSLASCLFPRKAVKQCLIWDLFCDFPCWTPWHGQKGPIKKGLSFCLSVHPYLVICDRAGFFLKKMISTMIKKDQKTWFFGLFKKIKSLFLSGIVVKRKFLWSFNILQKLHTWEKSGSQVIMAKNGSRLIWDFSIL